MAAVVIDSKHSLLMSNESNSPPSQCSTFCRKYFFIFGILCIVIFAASYPNIGCNECILRPSITASWVTVILIFVLRGVSMKATALKKATVFWELNLFTHLFIFVYIPITAYFLSLFLRNYTSLNSELIDGLLILSALPTTTVTCAVLTLAAEGNEAAAIVNGTVTNLTGILLSPTAILVLLGSDSEIDILSTIFQLAMKIMVPLCVGQIIRKVIGDKGRKWINKKKAYFKKGIEFCLFFIIFCAISESFYTGFDADVIDIFYVVMIVIGLHWFLLLTNWYYTLAYSKLCCCTPFDSYDRIAILLCGCQKTVAMGLPLIETMFENDPNVGLYIIPLLLYHPFQLIFDSLLVYPISNWRAKQEVRSQRFDAVESSINVVTLTEI